MPACYIINMYTCGNGKERSPPLKKVFRYIKGYGKEVVLAPLMKMLEAFFELLVPLAVASMIDKGIGEGNGTHIVNMTLIMVLLCAVGLASSVTAQYFAAKAAVGFSTKLRLAVFEKISNLSYSAIDKTGTATLITRVTADVNTLQNGVNLALRLLLRSPFIVGGAAVMAVIVDPSSAKIFLVTIGILAVVVYTVMFVTMPLYKKVQGKLDALTVNVRESLGGARVVRAFGREAETEAKFSLANSALNALQKLSGSISALTNPVTYAVLNGAIVYLIYTGAIRVDSGAITVGAVIALYNYMSQILVELVKLANLIVTMTKAGASAQRIAGILDISEEKSGSLIGDGRCALSFDNVSFAYNETGDSCLKNISFELECGETLGIIGSTGSGKTTLVNLIGGFYEPTEGSAMVLGVDTKQWNKKALAEKCAYVPQKAVLFSGTLRENLRMGKRDATDEEMEKALENAMAIDFVKNKSGLDTPVSEGGKNFSGGQRQRLAIARALIRQTPILMLDDSASALDMATEASLRENVSSMKNTTKIIVSQRTSSVMHADKIIVLEKGEAVGIGRHAELLEACPVYREIYESQFGGEAVS